MTQKEFEKEIDLIGQLYESGKDCLNRIIVGPEELADKLNAFDVILKLRDKACENLRLIESLQAENASLRKQVQSLKEVLCEIEGMAAVSSI